MGCNPWGRWESDTTEQLHFHISLSCIGEGNGNPLQCSCLENPRDGGAWWAAVSEVAQSRTRLKRLSSSSSNVTNVNNFLNFIIVIFFIPWTARRSNQSILKEISLEYSLEGLILKLKLEHLAT